MLDFPSRTSMLPEDPSSSHLSSTDLDQAWRAQARMRHGWAGGHWCPRLLLGLRSSWSRGPRRGSCALTLQPLDPGERPT